MLLTESTDYMELSYGLQISLLIISPIFKNTLKMPTIKFLCCFLTNNYSLMPEKVGIMPDLSSEHKKSAPHGALNIVPIRCQNTSSGSSTCVMQCAAP